MKEVIIHPTERDYGISLLRVISMMMIILCHIFNYVHLTWLAQFFNVGVYVFLLISGWLYSNKVISNVKTWLVSRWKKLCIPIIVWMVITSIYVIITEQNLPDLRDIILLSTNTQGISWIIRFFPEISRGGMLGGLAHLWFVSVIILCYFILIVVKKYEKNINSYNLHIVCIASLVIFVLLRLCGINISYFLCFFIGYFLRKKELIPTSKYWLLSVCTIISILIRLICKKYFDGTDLYNNIIVCLTHIVISIWIFITVIIAENKINCVHSLATSVFMSKCDSISYYIYVTHYFFVVDSFHLANMAHGLFLQMCLFSILTIITAIAIKFISNKLATII